MVTSSDPDLYERAVRYHDQGGFRMQTRFPGITPHQEEFLGESYRMSELTGAVALAQLRKLDTITGTLRARFKRFREATADIPGIKPQPVNDETGCLGVRWGIVFEDAETCKRFSDALRQEGLSPSLMYGGQPIYMRPSLLNRATATPESSPWTSPLYTGDARYYEGLCPASEDIMKRVLIVASVNARYTDRDVDEIVRIVRTTARKVF